MRYTPTLKLSTRLVAFVTLIVTSAMFILFIGGTLSFQRMGQEYLNHYLQGIVEVVDKELEDPDAAYSMQRWMPKMLQASNIVEMQLSSQAGTIYRFKDTSSKADPDRLYSIDLPLARNQGYSVHFKAVPPLPRIWLFDGGNVVDFSRCGTDRVLSGTWCEVAERAVIGLRITRRAWAYDSRWQSGAVCQRG